MHARSNVSDTIFLETIAHAPLPTENRENARRSRNFFEDNFPDVVCAAFSRH